MTGAGSASQMPVSYKGLGDQQQIKILQTSPPQNVTAPLPGVPGVGHSATDQARGPSQSPQTRICISHDRVHPSQSPRKVMQLSLKLWLLAAIPWEEEEEEEEGAPLKGEGRVLAAVTGRELAAVRIPTGSKARGGRGSGTFRIRTWGPSERSICHQCPDPGRSRSLSASSSPSSTEAGRIRTLLLLRWHRAAKANLKAGGDSVLTSSQSRLPKPDAQGALRCAAAAPNPGLSQTNFAKSSQP